MPREFITDFQHNVYDAEREAQQLTMRLGNAITSYGQSPLASNLINCQRVVDELETLIIELALQHNDEFPDDLVPWNDEEDEEKEEGQEEDS